MMSLLSRINVFIAVFFLTCCCAIPLHAQDKEVYKIDDASASLEKKWSVALNLASLKNFSTDYWIGYCVSRLMEKNSYIGSFDSKQRNAPSLFETIYDMKIESEPEPEFDSDCGSFSGTITIGDGKSHHQKIVKKIGILLLVNATGETIKEVKCSNMSLHVNLEKKPIIWIGAAKDEESAQLLVSQYPLSAQNEIKKEIVSTIGLHSSSTIVLSFLTEILSSNEHNEVREETVFWIGQQGHEQALPLLTKTARTDTSEDIREKAIFSISQVESNAGVDSLISLARRGRDKEMRGKAMFWLAQKASEKGMKAVRDVIDDEDEDAEIQRQALFALTQNDDEKESVDVLIIIAKTHHNSKIRKEAIFWLGQTDNPKAIDALVEIVKK